MAHRKPENVGGHIAYRKPENVGGHIAYRKTENVGGHIAHRKPDNVGGQIAHRKTPTSVRFQRTEKIYFCWHVLCFLNKNLCSETRNVGRHMAPDIVRFPVRDMAPDIVRFPVRHMAPDIVRFPVRDMEPPTACNGHQPPALPTRRGRGNVHIIFEARSCFSYTPLFHAHLCVCPSEGREL